MNILRDLVSKTNVYINSRGKALNVELVRNITQWVGKMLCMFGLGEGEKTELGWGQADSSEGSVNVRRDSNLRVLGELNFLPLKREDILLPYLRTLSSFRDNVRKLAIAKGDTAVKDILALCDKLRDVDLVPLGVALDDQEGNSDF
jgi:cysteinyl-tRNA synthetase